MHSVTGKIRTAHVTAIVVNYRTPQLTVACVESLLASTGVELDTIVVDNHSADGSADVLRGRFATDARVTVLARDVNDGYAGGNNAGIELARRRGARHMFILNSDTIVDPNCVRLLAGEVEGGSRAALLSPLILYGDAPDRVWFGGARFSLWAGRPAHVGRGQPPAPESRATRDLAFATGCALLVDLDAIGPAPLFDVSLFSYAEDLDLSLRVREMGRAIRYVPSAVVRHFEGASHRKAGGQSLRFYL
ncbi:MAG: glycosyltransferase family 2 protein, partial [Gemmatimonadaceae bacterium]